jgi:hypothetical protein
MRNLSLFSFLDKRKLIEDAGITEAARAAIQHYLGKYGHDLADLAVRTRAMFAMCAKHHERLAYLEVISKCLGLDMANPKDRDELWGRMREDLNPSRTEAGGWSTGEIDPHPDALVDYIEALSFKGFDIKKPAAGNFVEPRRMSISRTLVYLRVLPPNMHIDKNNRSRLKELPDADQFPPELEECWMFLQRHPHYRNPPSPKKPRHELNQHALDLVRERFGTKLWIEPDDIGTVRSIFEPNLSPTAPLLWFFPYVIFKYATRCKIESPNQNQKNPLALIWNKDAPGHGRLWGGDR